MLKMIGSCIKFAILCVLILVLGNSVRWEGKTISDQVKVGMSHAEESQMFSSFRDWATKLTSDAQKGFKTKVKAGFNKSDASGSAGPSAGEQQEEISHTERQKLKALIRELNSSHKED